MGWLDFKKDIDFMGYRRYFLGLSLLLAIASVVAFFEPGPRFGTDFVGGTEVEVEMLKPVDAGAVRQAVVDAGFHSPDVVAIENEKGTPQFLIRVKEVSALTAEQKTALQDALCLKPEEPEQKLDATKCPPELVTTEVKFSPGGEKVTARYEQQPCEGEKRSGCDPRAKIAEQLVGKVEGLDLRQGDNNPTVQNPADHKVEFLFKSKGDQIMDGLRSSLGADVVPEVPRRIEWIGPKAGKQLRDAAIKSISIAVIVIMLYIAFRFDMRFAPGSIAALVHDVFLAMGAMVVFQREVTLSTVAALLTIVGYSINDTVVVYDRIRENLGRYRKMTFPKVINRSITEMLGRTIRTSGLTAAAMIPFLFWGTGVIRDFAFTLLVGVVVGTYSSIYVAAPLTELIDRRIFGKVVKKKKRRRVRRKKKKSSPSPATA
jgi:preprotein translocase subunit SecF